MQTESLNLTSLKNLLPQADNYLLEEFLYNNPFTEENLKAEIEKIKQELNLEMAGNLIVNILLCRQSKKAARRKVAVLKAQKILQNLAAEVALDKEYFSLLLQAYGQVSSKQLIQDLEGQKTVDSLLEKLGEPRVVLKVKAEENLKFLNTLYQDKKITLNTFRRLYKIYGFEGSPELKKVFNALVQEIENICPAFKNKEELAAKVFLAEIDKDELAPMLNLYKTFPHPLTADDLETIYFKYNNLPESEVQKIFKAILTRLPYKEEPYENLALAVKILKEGRPEIFASSKEQAEIRQEKLAYMQELAKVPFFLGYQDELTLKFFGKKTLMELGLDFKALLNNLPYAESYKENADIGVKIMLGKIPFQAGYAQALYRKENKAKLGEDPLRIEALQNYTGPQTKEQVLEFFRLKLKPYTFYKEDDAAYCAALAYLIDELNGKNPPNASTVALELFEQGLNEKQVDEILNKFLQKVSFDEEALLTAYKRFYEINHDREDAAARILNMLD